MENLIVVGISDLKVVRVPDILITYALGSCVGICLYDYFTQIAGLSHILLPESQISVSDKNIMKYADTAITELLRQMVNLGASQSRITAKIAGGAQMFFSSSINIGQRNILAVRSELQRLNIKIIAEDTGDNYGRTLSFDSGNGLVTVKSISHGNKTI